MQKSTTDLLVTASNEPGAPASDAPETPIEVFDGRTDRWPMSTEPYRQKRMRDRQAKGC